MKRIVLFDGSCLFCHEAVRFIIKRDPKGHFMFASLQSTTGKKLLKQYQIPRDINSLLLIEQQTYYTKSTATLRICKTLQGLWKTLFLLIMIPKPIRDFFYHLIANNRYQWFGQKKYCILPPPYIQNRFLS